MPRFFFRVVDDMVAEDEDGLELPDLSAAEKEALRSARALACEQVAQGELHLEHRIEVEDESGERVLIVRFADAIAIEP